MVSNPVAASLLTENDYHKVANNFLAYKNCGKKIVSVEKIIFNQKNVGRVFHLDGGGYLIMPETIILPPIKGYSLKNDYDSLPDAYKAFLINELKIYQSNTNSKNVRTDSINYKKWDFLIKFDSTRQKKRNYIPDTFLLQTSWNQNYPYNKMLPKINNNNVLAGCTQAAQAQIMKYHQHPVRGKGLASHTWNNQTLETILFREYHWDNMPENVDNSTPEFIQDEVALLYKDLAIVNKADFRTDGTSSSIDVDALYEYFGYATDIQQMTNENENEFFSVIRNEIDNQRPILLSLPNHATVADGYASDATGKKIHINMGWGGHDDDYYYLNQTIHTSSYTFPVTLLRIKYNIKPCNPNENNCYENISSLEADDIQNGFQISGKFDVENDIDAYSEYLKGLSKIEGDRGYVNQAFYIDVYTSKNELVISSDDSIQYDFPVDYYTIKISLKGYTFDDFDSYEVNIATQQVTDIEMDAIHRLDDPPIINTQFSDQILSLGKAYKIRIDAGDKDGDMVSLSAVSSTDSVDTTIEDDVLTITATEAGHSRIFVIAMANDKQVAKSFDILASHIEPGWGKEFTIQGFFENQDDYNLHQLLLDNQCQIKGDNGFSNQAFYTSVLDHDQHAIIDMNDATIIHTFNKSAYWIGVSLNQNSDGYGKYYKYDPAHSGYTLFITCPYASWTFQDIAEFLGIEINDTNIIRLKHAILYMQILSGYFVPDIKDIMFIQNITQIGIKDVLYILRYVADN
jgi:hypothetical protein